MLDKVSHRQSQEESLARYGHPFGLHLTVPVLASVNLAAAALTALALLAVFRLRMGTVPVLALCAALGLALSLIGAA